MKPYLSLLALALSTTLFAAGCNRDRNADATPAADADMAGEPAMAPEPAPMGDAMPAPMSDSGMSFSDMDKNKDGGIVHQELADTEMLHMHFSDADTDGDGKLSSSEVDAYRANMAANPGG